MTQNRTNRRPIQSVTIKMKYFGRNENWHKNLVAKPEEKKWFVRRRRRYAYFRVRWGCSSVWGSGGIASIILNRGTWLYAPAALSPGKALSVPSGCYNRRAENSHCCQHRSTVHPLAQPCHYTESPPEHSRTYKNGSWSSIRQHEGTCLESAAQWGASWCVLVTE